MAMVMAAVPISETAARSFIERQSGNERRIHSVRVKDNGKV